MSFIKKVSILLSKIVHQIGCFPSCCTLITNSITDGVTNDHSLLGVDNEKKMIRAHESV